MAKTYAKAVVNGTTYIDLTADTVTADSLLYEATAHKKDGSQITGSFLSGHPDSFSLHDHLLTSAGKRLVTSGGKRLLAKETYKKT